MKKTIAITLLLFFLIAPTFAIYEECSNYFNITFSNAVFGTEENALINITKPANMNTNCSDVRIAYENETNVPFFFYQDTKIAQCDTNYFATWVKIYGNETINVYYGCNNHTHARNYTNTFIAGTDCGTTDGVDTTMWNNWGDSCTFTISNGVCAWSNDASGNGAFYKLKRDPNTTTDFYDLHILVKLYATTNVNYEASLYQSIWASTTERGFTAMQNLGGTVTGYFSTRTGGSYTDSGDLLTENVLYAIDEYKNNTQHDFYVNNSLTFTSTTNLPAFANKMFTNFQIYKASPTMSMYHYFWTTQNQDLVITYGSEQENNRTLTVKLNDTTTNTFLSGFTVSISNATTTQQNTTTTTELVLSNNTVPINSTSITITKNGYVPHTNNSFTYNNSQTETYIGQTAPEEAVTGTGFIDNLYVSSPIYVNDPFYYTARVNATNCTLARYNSSGILVHQGNMTQINETLFTYYETITTAGSYYSTITCGNTTNVIPIYVLTDAVIVSITNTFSSPDHVYPFELFYITARTNKTECNVSIYNSSDIVINSGNMTQKETTLFEYNTRLYEEGAYYVIGNCDGTTDIVPLRVVYVDLRDNINFWDYSVVESYNEEWAEMWFKDYYLENNKIVLIPVNETDDDSYMMQVFRFQIRTVIPFINDVRCYLLQKYLMRRHGTEMVNMSYCYGISELLRQDSAKVFNATDNNVTNYTINWTS